MITRRNAILSTLFGTGYVGLRALATGLPAAVFLKGSRALADTPVCADKSKAQYFILATSGGGDPINANCPGTYNVPNTNIYHNQQASMAPVNLTVGTTPTMAATPWKQLPTDVLQRTCFWHIMTNTPVHPKEPEVLKLLGATAPAEMLPSLLGQQMQPCLGTIQAQPISLGATSPGEALSFQGAALPTIPPLALKQTLISPTGPIANLQMLRDQTVSQLDELYRSSATPAQSKYLDSLIMSQQQVRGIRQDLLGLLNGIQDNLIGSQITAALALIQMQVTPVVTIHIPFGGDNHFDTALQNEANETVTGVAAIASLMSQLAAANLQDQVTFMSLNVFGRTLGPTNTDGRQHNLAHQTSITISNRFNGGIVGSIGPVGNDYGCVGIDSASGAGVPGGGDIAPEDTLASFGKTMLAGVGVDPTVVDNTITLGKVIQGAIKTS